MFVNQHEFLDGSSGCANVGLGRMSLEQPDTTTTHTITAANIPPDTEGGFFYPKDFAKFRFGIDHAAATLVVSTTVDNETGQIHTVHSSPVDETGQPYAFYGLPDGIDPNAFSFEKLASLGHDADLYGEPIVEQSQSLLTPKCVKDVLKVQKPNKAVLRLGGLTLKSVARLLCGQMQVARELSASLDKREVVSDHIADMMPVWHKLLGGACSEKKRAALIAAMQKLYVDSLDHSQPPVPTGDVMLHFFASLYGPRRVAAEVQSADPAITSQDGLEIASPYTSIAA